MTAVQWTILLQYHIQADINTLNVEKAQQSYQHGTVSSRPWAGMGCFIGSKPIARCRGSKHLKKLFGSHEGFHLQVHVLEREGGGGGGGGWRGGMMTNSTLVFPFISKYSP